jgi:hypothetical protein
VLRRSTPSCEPTLALKPASPSPVVGSVLFHRVRPVEPLRTREVPGYSAGESEPSCPFGRRRSAGGPVTWEDRQSCQTRTTDEPLRPSRKTCNNGKFFTLVWPQGLYFLFFYLVINRMRPSKYICTYITTRLFCLIILALSLSRLWRRTF